MFRDGITKWLLHDDQKDLFEILFALALNVVFVLLTALLLWPLGAPALTLRLAKGYVVLWLCALLSIVIVVRVQRFFYIDLYHHPDAFVYSNLAASSLLQVSWAALAALSVQSFIVGAPVWLVVILVVVALLSCIIAFYAVSAFYQGHTYKLLSLPLALASFVVFSVWPALARALYGWLFDLF